MQPTQTTNTGSLQGNAAMLQQQDTSTTYQQTGDVGQQALKPDNYPGLDNLTVQGTPSTNTSTAVAAGNNSPEVVLLVMAIVLVCGILLLRRFTKKSLQGQAIVNTDLSFQATETVTTTQLPWASQHIKYDKPNKKKSGKKTPSKVKKPTKKPKKSGKR